MVEDDFLASLLSLHDLHPVDVVTRVHKALERVRPYLGSHAGGVDLLGIDEQGVVHLSLQGSCEGCPSSTVTVKMAIERAVLEAAPEVTAIDVQGIVEPPGPRPSLVQLEPLQRAAPGADNGQQAGPEGGWMPLAEPGLPPGVARGIAIEGLPVLLCRVGDDLYAYRNACASCGSTLDGGALDGERLTCPACGAAYSIRLAGRGVDDESLYLDPLPLLPEDGSWRIGLPSREES
jgi:Fe-S cluster biogenesis protein NfuA/nitrite reductase/ring-hydroxylating ferredoxin subunit